MILNRVFSLPYYRSGAASRFAIGFLDGVPFYQNEYEFLLERRVEDYLKIQAWVAAELMPYMTRKTINEWYSSYGLKHVAQSELGFYVSNGDIKLILLENGMPFKGYPGSPNVSYPLSQKFYRVRPKRR